MFKPLRLFSYGLLLFCAACMANTGNPCNDDLESCLKPYIAAGNATECEKATEKWQRDFLKGCHMEWQVCMAKRKVPAENLSDALLCGEPARQ